MLSKIASFFLKLITTPNGRTFLALVVIAILVIMKIQSCNALNEADRLAKQNQAALKDMEIVKNKNGELSYQKALSEGTAKDLKKTNDSLYKALKAEKGNVKFIASAGVSWKSPEIIVDNQLFAINDTTKGLKWSNKNDYHTIEGMSTFGFVQTQKSYRLSAGQTTISKDEVNLSLITGLKEENGIYKIFITPKTPGVTISNIEGAIIDKKTILGNNISPLVDSKAKKGGLGIHAGIGIMPMVNSTGVSLGWGPVISVGYNYNVIRF